MAIGTGQWRRFRFFEKEIITKKNGSIFDGLKTANVFAAASSNGAGDGQLFFGSPDGSLSVVNRDYDINICQVFSKSMQLLVHSMGSTLAIVGNDLNDSKQSIKLFRTSDSLIEKDSIQTQKIISFTPEDPHPESKITAISITDRHIALGCENGALYFFTSGNLLKEKRFKFAAPFYRLKVPITNLFFVEGKKGLNDICLFATTKNSVHSFKLIRIITSSHILPGSGTSVGHLNLSLRDRRSTPSGTGEFTVVDLETDFGCEPACATLTTTEFDAEQQLIIANKKGVFSYATDDRRSALAIEGEKLMVSWWFSYLLIVTKESPLNQAPRLTTDSGAMNLPTITISTASKSNLIEQLDPRKTQNEIETLAIYGINPQLTAFSIGVSKVRCVLNEWGYIYLLTGEGDLLRLVEKDFNSRLELLFRSNCFPLALQLAKKHRTNKQGMAEISKQFGDHLYARNEYETATDQYCKTIGFLEPSYVIKRFLDSQHIDHLTRYLEDLHREKFANADHTTLLLNCYTKHPDRIKRLGEFIGLDENNEQSQLVDFNFDVNIAISVCRQAGYFQQALALSKKAGCHDMWIRIQIENCNEYRKALEYISQLSFDDAISMIRAHGKFLMQQDPKATTKLLKELKPSNYDITQEDLPESLINLFMSHSDELLDYLNHWVRSYAKEHIPSAIYDTILELLLRKYSSSSDKKDRDSFSKEIINLLANEQIDLDVTRAMVACQKFDFKAGIICLYNRAKLYQQILQYQMDNNEYEEIVKTCQTHGESDPQLWVQALSYFAKQRQTENCKNQIKQILEKINSKELLSPLLVIQTLSENESATLELVKDYLLQKLTEEQDEIKKDQEKINNFRSESEMIFKKIQKLETEPFVCQDPKCSACKMDLDLPCIHFFCHHSFHEGCVSTSEASSLTARIVYECPICSTDNRKLLDFITNQCVSKDTQETFHRQLHDRSDKFAVISDFLGRRLFDKTD